MKYYILLFLLSFAGFLHSQSTTNLYYVDCSSTNRLEKLKEIFIEQYKKSNGEKIVFISNDNFPIILLNEVKIDEVLKQLFYINPLRPDFFDVIDSLNSLLPKDILIRNNNYNYHFTFFLNAEQSFYDHTHNSFIKYLLLTNKIIDNNIIRSDIKITIIFDSNKSEISKDYITFLKNNYTYEIIEF